MMIIITQIEFFFEKALFSILSSEGLAVRCFQRLWKPQADRTYSIICSTPKTIHPTSAQTSKDPLNIPSLLSLMIMQTNTFHLGKQYRWHPWEVFVRAIAVSCTWLLKNLRCPILSLLRNNVIRYLLGPLPALSPSKLPGCVVPDIMIV